MSKILHWRPQRDYTQRVLKEICYVVTLEFLRCELELLRCELELLRIGIILNEYCKGVLFEGSELL